MYVNDAKVHEVREIPTAHFSCLRVKRLEEVSAPMQRDGFYFVQ